MSFRYSQLLRNKLQTSVKDFWSAQARGELDRKEKGTSTHNKLIKNSWVTTQSHPRGVGTLMLWCEPKPIKTGLARECAHQPVFSYSVIFLFTSSAKAPGSKDQDSFLKPPAGWFHHYLASSKSVRNEYKRYLGAGIQSTNIYQIPTLP